MHQRQHTSMRPSCMQILTPDI
jgi:hypothetical protein